MAEISAGIIRTKVKIIYLLRSYFLNSCFLSLQMKKATLLHLRIPFSFYLLPVFLFSAAVAVPFSWINFLLVGFILHFLLYPASNGYNSYFDRDEQSIGGLKYPPQVSRELYMTALTLDLAALGLGLLISWQFSLMLLIYGLVSKAYSHPKIRLKRMPVTGWLAAGLFQGYFTFMMVSLGLGAHSFEALDQPEVHLAGALTTLLLFGSYPMTQVYQHTEDRRRGDRTISLLLGVRGTFYFTAFFFSLAAVLFAWYFEQHFPAGTGWIFVACLIPVLVFFFVWLYQVLKDETHADYDRTMHLNFLSGLCLNAFFLWLLIF